SAGVPARSAPAKRRVPLGVVPAASAGRNWGRTGCGAPLRSATGPCPTGPAPAGDGPRANRHFPSVGAYVFPPEGNCIALFMQMSINSAGTLQALERARDFLVLVFKHGAQVEEQPVALDARDDRRTAAPEERFEFLGAVAGVSDGDEARRERLARRRASAHHRLAVAELG